jgi:type VI secretion system protein ImpF
VRTPFPPVDKIHCPHRGLRVAWNPFLQSIFPDKVALASGSILPNVRAFMPPAKPQQPLLPSLLDRLIDEEPDQSTEPLWRGSYRVDELREHVRRDLEFLLNTRHGRADLLTPERELSISTLAFGLPDFTGVVGGGLESRERIRSAVERSIRDYEPRLQQVQVEVVGNQEEHDRNVRLSIRAVLCVNPIEEPVVFDTTVESTTGGCEVRPG